MILLFLRPWYWLPTLASAIAGLFLSNADPGLGQMLLVFVAAGGLSAAAEGLNEIADLDADRTATPAMAGRLRLSAGSGVLAGARICIRTAWTIVLLSAAIGLGACAVLSGASLLAGGAILLLSAAYSLPPLRLKRRALASAVIHAFGYGPAAMALGAGAAIVRPDIAFWALVAGAWVAIVGQTADLLDLDNDREAGVRTLPVALGRSRSILLIAGASLLLLALATYTARQSGGLSFALPMVWLLYLAWLAALLWHVRRPLPAPLHLGTLLLEVALPLAVLH